MYVKIFFSVCPFAKSSSSSYIFFFSVIRLFYSVIPYHWILIENFFFVCMFFFYKYIFLIHKRYRKIFRKNQTHRRQIYFVFVCLLLLFVVVYGILLHWIFCFWENIFSYRILHIDFRYFWYVVIIIIIIIVSSHVSFVVL